MMSERDISMEYNHILELIKTVSESNLTNFHYEEGNVKIHMSSGDVVMEPAMAAGAEQVAVPVAQQIAGVSDAVNSNIKESVKDEVVGNNQRSVSANAKTINSPLVGTFYAAPSEDAESYVKVGDRVTKGQIIGIVEAMKLMNEIESEYDGVITEILVDNATGVEYGEALFVVE